MRVRAACVGAAARLERNGREPIPAPYEAPYEIPPFDESATGTHLPALGGAAQKKAQILEIIVESRLRHFSRTQ